jgi:hypothetical protein
MSLVAGTWFMVILMNAGLALPPSTMLTLESVEGTSCSPKDIVLNVSSLREVNWGLGTLSVSTTLAPLPAAPAFIIEFCAPGAEATLPSLLSVGGTLVGSMEG